VLISCSTYGTREIKSKEVDIPRSEAESLLDKINMLAYDPSSAKSDQLQLEILEIAKEYNLIPKDTSLDDLKPSFVSSLSTENSKKGIMPTTGIRGTAALCNFATTGEGSQLPIIILPRLIPILLIPIPRIFLHWSSLDGYTSCGSYLTGTGFIAGGRQTGTAIGFWGIGFSVFLPPVMANGFFGYALFATCTADYMEPWPPNNPPIILDEKPLDGIYDIPVSQSELSFKIEDKDGDKMDFSVRTFPDIGSADEFNKKNGIYTIPINNLEPKKFYSWSVELTDGVDTIKKEYSFMTEELPFNPFDEG